MSNRRIEIERIPTITPNVLLHVSVYYDEGSYNRRRGYVLRFTPTEHTGDGFTRIRLMGDVLTSGCAVFVEETKRFNQKRLDQLAAVVKGLDLYRSTIDKFTPIVEPAVA